MTNSRFTIKIQWNHKLKHKGHDQGMIQYFQKNFQVFPKIYSQSKITIVQPNFRMDHS